MPVAIAHKVNGFIDDARGLAKDVNAGRTSFEHAINALYKKYGKELKRAGSNRPKKMCYYQVSHQHELLYGTGLTLTGKSYPNRKRSRRSSKNGGTTVDISATMWLPAKSGESTTCEYQTSEYKVWIVLTRR